jgi:uncharacterized membrane protein YfcA
MAYGVSSTSLLLATGVPPALASSSVHASELVTTFLSGVFHFRLGNVDRALLWRLALPGALGGAAGAYFLSSVDGSAVAPFVSAYLLLMGLRILLRVRRWGDVQARPFDLRKAPLLALVGGTLDAIGGGGWGPVVTTSLVSNGHAPRSSIGTVNTAEFLVTVAEVAVFTSMVGIQDWRIVVGLTAGGAVAAPLAALVCKVVPMRAAMAAVGLLITSLSAWKLGRLL